MIPLLAKCAESARDPDSAYCRCGEWRREFSAKKGPKQVVRRREIQMCAAGYQLDFTPKANEPGNGFKEPEHGHLRGNQHKEV